MTTGRLMVRFHEDDVVDAVRNVVGTDVEVKLTPPCACCNATIGYARDRRALWIFPQLWPPKFAARASVTGFETNEELHVFLSRLKGKSEYATIAPALLAAFAEGAN